MTAPDLGPDARIWRAAAVVLLAAAFVLVTVTAGDYGYNVDEWVQSLHGIALADWYADVLRGPYAQFTPEFEAMSYYGGSFELPAEVASRLSPFDRTTTRHLVTAWVAIVGLAGAYLLGRTVHGRGAGALTVLLLLLTPRFYGHFWSNPKDLPFAAYTVWGLYLTCRALPLLPRPGAGRVLGLGFAIGLGLGLRIGAIITLGYFGMALLWWLGGVLVEARRRGERPSRADLVAPVLSVLGVVGTAWCVMLAFWPWAQTAPFAGPLRALRYYGDLAAHGFDFYVFFEGRDFLLHEVPRRFTVEFFLISMPEFALLAPLALVTVSRWARATRRGWPSARTMGWLLVGTSIALPLGTTASWSVAQYDGTRHFLFVMPSMALVLAAAIVSALGATTAPRLRAALLAAVLGLTLVTAYDMVRLHPYEYVYFNRSVAGGPAAAARRYETDYLGLSYREGMRWLAAHDPAPGRPTLVTNCPGFAPNLEDAIAAVPGAAEHFVAVSPWKSSEVALASTRDHCNEKFDGIVLNTIERAETPLMQVIRAR